MYSNFKLPHFHFTPPLMPPSYSPPWEALVLIGRVLDPGSLASASCVSKSFHSVMSSDHLWLHHCLSHLSSSLHLSPSISPRRLFAQIHTSNRRICRLVTPTISLTHLIFTIDVLSTTASAPSPILSVVKDGAELDQAGVFRFDVEVGVKVMLDGEEMRVRWTVAMKGQTAALTLMDCGGKGRVVGSGRWFTEKLPGPRCCMVGSGVAAEVGMGMEGGEGRVSLGLMYDVGCMHLSVENGLSYLQPFLLRM